VQPQRQALSALCAKVFALLQSADIIHDASLCKTEGAPSAIGLAVIQLMPLPEPPLIFSSLQLVHNGDTLRCAPGSGGEWTKNLVTKPRCAIF